MMPKEDEAQVRETVAPEGNEDASPSSHGVTRKGDSPPPSTRKDGIGGAPPPRIGATLTLSQKSLFSVVLPPGGLRLGEYLLHSELGRGGMGVVYKALHRALKREVAVKLMLSDDESDRARFRFEAESSAGLKHPFIVPVHDVRVEAGKLFFAMDFIDGKTLKQLILERPGDLRVLLEVFMKVCTAIGYAHSKGIIHRDLKPQNIMIDHDLNPHVMDFGLARRVGVKDVEGREVHGTMGTMAMGTIVGTPAFMPPEQAGGRVDEIDTRSDIYALGVNLYFILTASYPYEATSTLELLDAIDSSTPPKPPRERDPRCPWELERIALKAISKRREDRYQTAFELMDDIRAWLAGEPVAAAQGGIFYGFRNSMRRHRGAITLGFLAFATIAGSAQYLIRRNKSDDLDRQVRAAAFVADSAAEIEVARARLRDYDAAKQSHDTRSASYLLRQASARYAKASARLIEASGLDPENAAAMLTAKEALLGSLAVNLLVTKDLERQRRADDEDERRGRADAAAADAEARLAATDPTAAIALAHAQVTKHEIAAAREVFLDAVGLERDSRAAQDAVATLVKTLRELNARQEAADRRARVEALVAEGEAALAQASAERDRGAAQAALRQALAALREATRLDPEDPTARTRRVDAALRLGALAIEDRGFSLAEHLLDEVRATAGDRGVLFLEEVRLAKQKKVR